MGTLNARNLTQALSQARNVGLVEESFVVDGMSVVVRNLRPDQYDSIFKECQGLSEVEYLNAWQMSHVTRAICEINGIDFRDVSFVEEEEPDPKRPNQTRTVKVELHTWLYKNLVSTWTREIVYICYRKVADAIESGETKAQEGVTFRVSDETAEDKYRRLMGDLKEVEKDVPPKVLDTILRENGLLRRATTDELENVNTKFAALKEAVNEQPTAVVETPAVQPAVAQPVVEAPLVEPTRPTGPPSADRIAELLRNRTPMNQPINPILAEERPTPPPPSSGAVNLNPQNRTPEIVLGSTPKASAVDPQTVLDAPPVGGINPRFRPPTR